MDNPDMRNSPESQRKRLNKIAVPFASWLNVKGVEVIKIFRKSRDSKRETEAARVELRHARAEAFARGIFRPLVDLTVDLTKELQQQKRRSLRFKIFEAYSLKIDTILKRIVEEYPTQPKLSDFSDVNGIPVFSHHPIYSGRHYEKALAVSDRLRHFLWLADEGVFADFRRCAFPTCTNYFYPLRPERLYCQDACQRQRYLQDPRRKDKNAADQKVHYYTKKVLDLAKLAAVNPDYQEKYSDAKKALKVAQAMRARLKAT
jgi:hypothetical protein